MLLLLLRVWMEMESPRRRRKRYIGMMWVIKRHVKRHLNVYVNGMVQRMRLWLRW